MNKYLAIVRLSLQEYFVYRLNFILWRVRIVLSILITFFLWQAAYATKELVFNYSLSQMLTYIILLSFIHGVVLSTQTTKVSEEIVWGNLSNFLIRPINYFYHCLSRDFADKIVNTVCSVIEITLLIVLFKPPIFLQTNPSILLFFAFSIMLAAFLYFLVNMLLSIIGFWSKDVWAPRFIFYIVVAFLAGTYFPLDIVPSGIYRILQFLPFTYMVFFPLKIYLGNFDLAFLLKGFLVSAVWSVCLAFLLKLVWQKGLRKYTAEGR